MQMWDSPTQTLHSSHQTLTTWLKTQSSNFKQKSIFNSGHISALRLDNYYVHPTCTPTRAALMTGRYAANIGLGVAFVPGNPGGLLPQYTTLADKLADLGYSNYLVGKWHLGNAKMMYHPLKRGFHNFFGVLGKYFVNF